MSCFAVVLVAVAITIMHQVVWIGVPSYDISHRRKRRGQIGPSRIDDLDRRLVENCVEEAAVYDLDVLGECVGRSLDEVKSHIVGIALLRLDSCRHTVVFGEQRVMSTYMFAKTC